MSEAMGSSRPRPPDEGPSWPSADQGQPSSYPPTHSGGPWPPAGLSPSDERTWGMLSHLGALVVTLVSGLGVLVPLVVLLTKGTQSPFVRRHALESLNFQITVLLMGVLGGIVAVVGAVVTLGLGLVVIVPVVLAYLVFVLVVQVLASVRANNGEDYRYPLTLRLVS